MLRPGGTLLVKSFISDDLHNFTAELKRYFSDVQRTKPEATRQGSSEFYFFAKGFRRAAERQRIERLGSMPEFRQDPVTGRWVIIAAKGGPAPAYSARRSDSSQAEPCPFCAGNETMTPPEVWAERRNQSGDNAPGWRVRVVPNKYPALEPLRAKSRRQQTSNFINRAAVSASTK